MDLVTAPFSELQLRAFFGRVPTGVLALAAESKSEAVVMTVCSFTAVSLEPPLLVVSIRQESTTWPCLKRAGRIGGSILSRDQAGLARQFSSGEASMRIADTPVTRLASGALLFEGASAWFEAEQIEEFPVGDHYLAVLEINAIEHQVQSLPLVFHRSNFVTVAAS
ncbi:flavin reductase family protein [Pseudonocardia asaccharolytica]|uniref:Flavin reductase like domain-containing protein n=1 Tax=Pseudonocardia asaccharolytica DSM 44247 = NBRC 16224 TaxID=1123024 RepID=A0A511D5Z9_9PSEU|nr:flavin reductase family protein [Pseudonocardia asaccharolytica]GEL20216.1 hypothetical protein PA7_40530 [Pseudonocardia asaccharolytica DSM 44247 = NBRC 16224]